MGIIPVKSHSLRQALCYLPILKAVFRGHHLAHWLDTTFGIGKRAVFFKESRTRQKDMRIVRGFVQEDVVHDHAFHRRKPCGDMLGIRVGLQDILTLNIDCLEYAINCGIEHIGYPQSGFRIDRNTPFGFKHRARIAV
jgi:hypothetical protein